MAQPRTLMAKVNMSAKDFMGSFMVTALDVRSKAILCRSVPQCRLGDADDAVVMRQPCCVIDSFDDYP